jgi:hypothetical protein
MLGEPTRVEQALWDAFPSGAEVDLRAGDPEADDPVHGPEWGLERTVRAEFIAALLLGAQPPQPGCVAAIRLIGARITGQIVVAGGVVGGELALSHCHLAQAPDFREAATRTVRFTGCHLPGLLGTGLRADGRLVLHSSVVRGAVKLPRAQLTGGLRLDGALLHCPDDYALFAGGMTVEGGTFGRQGLRVEGGVRLTGARMGGGLFFEGATLHNPAGEAITADNVIVEDICAFSDGFTAEGTIRLRGARVDGRLSFDQAVLRAPAVALRLDHMDVRELILTPRVPIEGSVSLAYSRIGVLADTASAWPADVRLNGLTYESLRIGSRPLSQRLDWVSRDSLGYRAQPYEQLATWFRRIGHDDQARAVLLAKQRARRSTLRRGGRFWGYLLDWTVGYGYRAWLAAVWFALLLAVGTVTFTIARPTPLGPPGEVPQFNALVYTFDLLLPLGAFGMRDAWQPVGGTRWLAYALIAAGWMLATALVAGVTRVLRPN